MSIADSINENEAMSDHRQNKTSNAGEDHNLDDRPTLTPMGVERGAPSFDNQIIYELFSFSLPEAGIQFKVDDVSGDITGQHGEVGVMGSIHKTGIDEPVGEFTRSLYVEGDDLIVSHDALNLDAALQGQGITKAWLDHCQKEYHDLGVAEIRTYASQVGSYAWAKAGYEWHCPSWMEPEKAVSDLEDGLNEILGYAVASEEITNEEQLFLEGVIQATIETARKTGSVDMKALANLSMTNDKELWGTPNPEETQLRALGKLKGPRTRSLGQLLLTDLAWYGRKSVHGLEQEIDQLADSQMRRMV